MRFSTRAWCVVWAVVFGVVSSGCVDINTMLEGSLNARFLAELGMPIAPTAPGDAPFLTIRCLNLTDQRVLFYPSWSSVAGSTVVVAPNIGPDMDIGFAVPCPAGSPVERVTLGDVDNPAATSAFIIFDDFTRQEMGRFPLTLVEGVDFMCGDVIVFAAIENSSTVSGYSLVHGVLDGSAQPTEYSGASTYDLLLREFSELVSQGRLPFGQ